MARVEFHFDLGSPNAYLSHLVIPEIERRTGVNFEYVPVLLGGVARPALERAGRIADGWVTSSRTDLSRIAEGVGVIRAAASQAGRDPDAVRIVCRGVVRAGAETPAPEGSGRLLLSGSPDQIREDTRWLAGQGVTEVFYDLNWDPMVGSPGADPAAATARAEEILEALAP